MYFYLFNHFLKFFQAFLIIFTLSNICEKIFTDISDISIKSKYRYIRKIRNFNPCVISLFTSCRWTKVETEKTIEWFFHKRRGSGIEKPMNWFYTSYKAQLHQATMNWSSSSSWLPSPPTRGLVFSFHIHSMSPITELGAFLGVLLS